eukprot:6181130-Pleurochrysis_carterae.AAC.1
MRTVKVCKLRERLFILKRSLIQKNTAEYGYLEWREITQQHKKCPWVECRKPLDCLGDFAHSCTVSELYSFDPTCSTLVVKYALVDIACCAGVRMKARAPYTPNIAQHGMSRR